MTSMRHRHRIPSEDSTFDSGLIKDTELNSEGDGKEEESGKVVNSTKLTNSSISRADELETKKQFTNKVSETLIIT